MWSLRQCWKRRNLYYWPAFDIFFFSLGSSPQISVTKLITCCSGSPCRVMNNQDVTNSVFLSGAWEIQPLRPPSLIGSLGQWFLLREPLLTKSWILTVWWLMLWWMTNKHCWQYYESSFLLVSARCHQEAFSWPRGMPKDCRDHKPLCVVHLSALTSSPQTF